MAFGPGKYDEFAVYVREHTQAEGVVVLVLDGNLGSGHAQVWLSKSPMHTVELLARGAQAVRQIAEQMERDALRIESRWSAPTSDHVRGNVALWMGHEWTAWLLARDPGVLERLTGPAVWP